MRKRITTILLFVLGLLLVPSVALAEDGTITVSSTEWTDGTWTLSSDVEIEDRVTVTGNVTLQLDAGYTLKAKSGITVNKNNTLIITGTGTLIANENRVSKYPGNESTYGLAGIGSDVDGFGSAGNIVINSGTIVAYGGEGKTDGTNYTRGGAGIGSTEHSFGGTVTINGGNVTAYGGGTSETGGAGIGGGNGAGGNVIINGGTVHAQGGASAAAIGSGNGPSDQGYEGPHKHTTVEIKGGVVSVGNIGEGGTVSGDGVIGGDWKPGNVSVTITGGQVTGRIGTVDSDTKLNRTTTVSLGWDTKDSDFIDAFYPGVTTLNSSLTLTSDWRKDNDTKKLTSDEVTAFTEQTKIVPYYTCNVTFDSNNGSPETTQEAVGGMAVAQPENPTKEGYRFDGWYNGDVEYDFSAAVTSDLTLTAYWVKTHTVSFNSNGGSAVATQIVDDGQQATAPEAPTRDKYNFLGWYNGDAAYDFKAPVTSDITLKAHWVKIHTVTFDSNGGSAVEAQTVDHGQQAVKPDNPTRYKYRFVGWFSDKELTKKYDFSTPVYGDLKLYAKWTQTLATLTFDLAGGTLDGKTGEVTVEASIGDTIRLPSAPTRDGYTFRAWKGSEYKAGAKYKVTGDHTFTAAWTKKENPVTTYTITFDANGGTGSMSPIKAEAGSKVTLTANRFTRDGYTFYAWNTKSDGTGTRFVDRATVQLEGNATLYAQWTKRSTTSGTTRTTTTSSTRRASALASTADPSFPVAAVASAGAVAALAGVFRRKER